MTEKRKRDWRGVGCAALIGASIAFPIGIIVGSNRSSSESAEDVSRPNFSDGQVTRYRRVYSPQPSKDPFVIEHWQKVVEALEASCRKSHLRCVEAEQARLFIKKAEARRSQAHDF